jgi:hypothetical protein
MCWKHLSDTMPKARKPHCCHLCGLPIAVGQVHVARRGVFEGGTITQRMHTDCEEVTHDWREDDWENFDEFGFREEKASFFANEKVEATK